MAREKISPEQTQTRWKLLRRIDRVMNRPLMFLSFVWLVLIIIDLSVGLNRVLLGVFYIIWALFIIDFIVKLIIAPDKWHYLKNSWSNIISITIPGFRLLNIFSGFKLIQLLKLYTSISRSLEGLVLAFEKRGFTFILILTIIVIFAGASGILYFENPDSLHKSGIYNVRGIRNYWEALWWTAMLTTTIGSDYWPKTVGGRILCWIIAVYAFTFFGYITATLASYFVEPSK